MFQRKPLAAAIGSIAAIGAVGSLGVYAPVAFGAEPTIEEVIVTGSRIRQQVSDAPRPVSVIDRDQIDLSGLNDVESVLRNTTFNSFGSFRERSGSSFGQIALIDLRGLGPDRTAVLVNGRRVPGNPLTGSAAVDLNTIPLNAVERIEVLTDSASAVYGADAIGGVVNVVMREDFNGAEFEVGAERPDRKGADTDYFNFTIGSAGERGSVLFSGEWNKTDPIFDADRDYSQVQIMDNPNGGLPRHAVDTVGVSSGGNTFFELDFSDAFPAGTCPTDTYIPVSNPEGIPDSEGCGFGYADLSLQTGGIDRKSTFLDARYNITDDHTVYFENRYTDSRTFGRYAPAVGFFLVDDEAPLNPTLGTPEQRDLFLFHRFIAHGNRDDSVNLTELDSVLGLTGTLFDEQVNYDAYVRYYEYDASEKGQTYVISSIIEDLVASGEYNFLDPTDPDNADAVQMSSATLLRDISMEHTGAGITFDGFAFDLPAGKIGWAAGLEVASEDYKDQYDSFREAGNVLGSAGNSAAGDRSRWAAFGEVSVPVIDTLELGFAARYDDYDLFGSEFSPSVSARFQPIEQVVLRASWGEGFKAPNLGDLFQELSFSAETVTDLTRCRAQGIPDADCPDSQVEEYTGGNPDLEAEQSESVNVGLVVQPTGVLEGLTVSFDWYNIEIDEAVETLDLQDVIQLEQANSLPPGVIVNRGPTENGVPGIITRCEGSPLSPPDCGLINVFGNLATKEVEGYDVRGSYRFGTENYGQFQADLTWSKIEKFDEQPLPGGEVLEQVGTDGFPENRANFSLKWQYDAFTVNYIYRWIDETEGVTPDGKYPEFETHDITGVWTTPWNGELTVGVRNLTDEDPSIDTVSGYDDEVVLLLYDVAGRVPFASYRHTF